jgi:DNA mismatch repair protein MutS
MPAPHNSADSPVMRQYLEVKGRYPDAIIFFRMGDFYEMFFDDALVVAPILDIAVTSRDKNAEDPVPMAGIPYHAVGGYLRTLVEHGLKVAICEQIESPDEAKKRKGPEKIVRRDVVRVVTPGALLDEEHLQSGEANYFAVLCASDEHVPPQKISLAALDISQGDFLVVPEQNAAGVRAELARLGPRELLAAPHLHTWLREVLGDAGPKIEALPDSIPTHHYERVDHLYAESTTRSKLSADLRTAAAAALAFAEHTQPGQTLLIHRLREHQPGAHLVLDEASLRNLEIFRTTRDGAKKGSLLWAVDETRTAMGARLLREWLGAPLRDLKTIAQRQEGVELLLAHPTRRAQVQSRLKDIRDIVRLAARARFRTISPRELGAVRDSLRALPQLALCLQDLAREAGKSLPSVLMLGEDLLGEVEAQLTKLLVDSPPSISREGGFIREGADPELDVQFELRDGGRSALAAIEVREREATGIPNLRVQHNRVFGYFIEIAKSQLAKVPVHYVRKQTTANAERYVTQELAELESKVLGAQSEALIRELALFEMMRDAVSTSAERLCELGEKVATIDVLAGFAEIAGAHGYVRPELNSGTEISIVEGRHPVVERVLDTGSFVPNDTHLRADSGAGLPRLWLITGPNMGGKSTVMRQVALIAILAHVGSYVPARSAALGFIDRIFTRVGAADDLGRGESTFMVEMRETAQILAQATSRSLVLLDEIGRGTATYDGLSLAWAISEHLHDQIGCRTLFATHYHELCGLAARLTGIANVHVSVHEERGHIVFLHRIEKGAAGRSYGIQVGRLAGLPPRVLRRAGRILERLEQSESTSQSEAQLHLFAPRLHALEDEVEPVASDRPVESSHVRESDPVFDRAASLVAELRGIDLDNLTPREAHLLLERWKQTVAET